ncbi:ABC-type bacteriocin/lantibiotic exporter with double-glycine peptidase domain [Streptomyces sp. TLI_235]|nr:peptidase domain-containing ABC transporter [Streptomyces sp. TLI_235]PBC66210.1 ABC-type bacteriocin/lantibiotic exporter with double-glycine peptidase domain [Streptomyces sp. TLI_235]
MTERSRFRAEALNHHAGHDTHGPVLGADASAHRPGSWTQRVRLLRERLRDARRGGRVPVCFQTQVSDCGPACLVMTLRHHGIDADLDTVRARADSGRNGASARTLLELARGFGLRGRGVRAELDSLPQLAPGTILFWNFDHFVVLESATKDYVDVVDPAFGRRRLSRASVTESFTGVALEFEAPLAGTRAAPSARSIADRLGPWERLRPFLPRGRELRDLAAVSTALMALELVLPLTTGYLVGHVLPGGPLDAFWLAACGLGLITVLFLTLQLARSLLVAKRQALIEKRLTWGIVEHLVSLPYDWFTVRSPGDLAMRVRTSNALNQVLGITAVSATVDSLLIVVYLIAIVFANAVLACLVILLIALQVVITAVSWRRQVNIGQEVLERQTKAQTELVELLESITTLKATGLEGRAAERWSHALVREVDRRLTSRRSMAVATALSQTVRFGAPLLVVLAGIWRVLHGQDSLGAALGFMTLTIALFAPLEGMFGAASQLAMVRPTVARLDDVLRSVPEPRGELAGTGVPEPGRITAEDVSFRYPGAPRPTLTGISLDIAPGEFVAVIGRSGSGKSTLGTLLAGLQLPTSGTVTVDGADLARLDRPTYRAQIGYINQNAHLFGGTIRDNITFGTDGIDQADLVEAVRLARIHEEIEAFPMGYNTLVGPGGHGLSGGQRQRIVLARALARKPRLLVLDEATSALDPGLEQEILTGLLAADVTVVAIAHRLTVLDRADQVLVLRDGRIVETGTPADLVAHGREYQWLS